jgi:hypothetical protein
MESARSCCVASRSIQRLETSGIKPVAAHNGAVNRFAA